MDDRKDDMGFDTEGYYSNNNGYYNSHDSRGYSSNKNYDFSSLDEYFNSDIDDDNNTKIKKDKSKIYDGDIKFKIIIFVILLGIFGIGLYILLSGNTNVIVINK